MKKKKKNSHNINPIPLDILGNFDITSNNQQHQQQTQQQQQQQHQYTPSSSSGICIDPIFSLSFPEQDSIFPSFDPPPPIRNNIGFARRHSVAVSGGIADFNILNLSQNYQSTSQSTFNNHTYTAQTPPQNQTQSTTLPQRLPVQQQSQQQQLLNKQAPFLSQKIGQHLTTVVEGETPSNMGHRASMPNIFLSEESQRQLTNSIQQRNGSLSARTTPNSTPPPISIDFNQMPWSNTSNNSISAATKPNHINNDFHDTNSPQFHDWTSSTNTLTSHPPVSQAPVANVEDHSFTGRKRFYSQQFPNFPTRSQHRIVPFNQTPYRTLQQPPGSSSSSNNSMCPLPMSGIVSRRASIATPHDISAWNRMVNPNDRILLEQQEQTSQKRAKDEEPATKRLRADESELSENTSASGSIVSTENNGPKEEEDYPVITDADLEAAKKDANAIPRRQKLRFDEDDYTPKWVRYTGQSKEGYCDTCKPGKWLQLKNSAYWYHKQFYHGISSVSGKIFQRPLEQRAGEHDVIEGLCHQCQQFVPICNSKRKNSVLWFRHAHKVKYVHPLPAFA